MTSMENLNFNSDKCTDNETVVIDIYKKLEKLPIDEQNCHAVCVCRVPKSLTWAKPEVFIPQFVGLGPYHHFGNELIMTDELKLGVAKRVLQVKDLLPCSKDLCLQNFLPHIQAFYHHVDFNLTYDYRTLLYILTVDGLFLLALLHKATLSEGRYSSFYILTGKQYGMPLVNAAGVELTMDGIMRDIFMLENQIPTHILEQITRVNESKKEIQQDDTDLRSTMLNFCKALCPLVNAEKDSKNPEACDHLLDLMYHLIKAPELEPQSNFKPDPDHDPEPRPDGNECIWFFAFLAILALIITSLLVYLIVLIWRLIISSIRYLFRTIQWVFGPLPNFFHMLNRWIDSIEMSLSRKETKFPIYKALRQYIGQTKEIVRGFFQSQDMTKWEEGARPSATELHKAGIHLQHIEGGISSIKFDDGINFQTFYLPCIRVNAISEVIITNLMAYESLTKSNCLIFTWYIELMSSLIQTAEDVKLLVREKIIETQLSDEDVVQIFNGMRKMIRSTKIPKLEEEIKKVNAKFKVKWYDVHNPLHYQIMFIMVVVAITFGAIEATQMLYCAFNPSTKFCKPPETGDYGRNNDNFISSM